MFPRLSILNCAGLYGPKAAILLTALVFSVLGSELALPSARALAADVGPFGTTETESHNVKMFHKWVGMLERNRRDQPSSPAAAAAPAMTARGLPQSGGCKPNRLFRCKPEEWRALVERLKGKPLKAQLEAVNYHMNRSPYIIDPVNWGVPDYWETLKEFFNKNGDCEDYAIAKYITLKALGVPAETMRIVVVEDTNLDVPHAVMSILIDGKFWILDNQVDAVLPDDLVRHYRPIYSINETTWWRHDG